MICAEGAFSPGQFFLEGGVFVGALFFSVGCFCPSGGFFSVDDVFVRAVFLSGYYFLSTMFLSRRCFSSGTLFS